ncbi:hypothetical protein V5O48_001582 [Marasmius crinis-equi]|uniref:Uncharacterized protein n=1 Tax=Marasmius crinis-equi TaxID=585013 RepID=A0ABR3FY81_9AGAR
MASKQLSTGTLSLRFMQNARNRQSKETQLEKAHVEDDGQWEVANEVRDSWGVNAQAMRPISHEPSYLPFLFPPLPPGNDTSTAAPNVVGASPSDLTSYKRRRVFNKGKEVEEQLIEITATSTAGNEDLEDPQHTSDEPSTQPGKPGKGKRTSTRLTMLSKSKSGESAENLRPGKAIAKSMPTAKLAIFDSSGVGTDLHPSPGQLSSSTPEKTALSMPETFMKPAGVDDPRSSGSVPTSDRERKRTSSTGQDGPRRKKKKNLE